MTEEELNERTLELERERFEFEKARTERESRFFYKNFATLISSALSVAVISISISQIWVAYIQRQQELIRQETALKLEKDRDDRKWNYDSLQFVATNKDVIFGGDKVQQERIRDVMLVAFPLPVLDRLFPEIRARAGEANKDVWLNGEQTIEARTLAKADAAHPDSPPDLASVDQLRRQLISADRRSISDRLAAAYPQNKSGVVTALISAILPQEDKNSYRNNLYIAVTFAQIKGGWEGSDTQFKAMEQLKEQTTNYKDATFKTWVDKALQNRATLR